MNARKLFCLLVPLLVVTGAAVPAGATEGPFVATGTILIGDPVTRYTGGVTEQTSPCMGSLIDPAVNGATNGIDGFWIKLPDVDPDSGLQPFAGRAATVTAPSPNDVDAWFYSDSCTLITPTADPDAYSMATFIDTNNPPNGIAANGDELHGKIPAYAQWVVVDLYEGAAANFTFTVTPPTAL